MECPAVNESNQQEHTNPSPSDRSGANRDNQKPAFLKSLDDATFYFNHLKSKPSWSLLQFANANGLRPTDIDTQLLFQLFSRLVSHDINVILTYAPALYPDGNATPAVLPHEDLDGLILKLGNKGGLLNCRIETVKPGQSRSEPSA